VDLDCRPSLVGLPARKKVRLGLPAEAEGALVAERVLVRVGVAPLADPPAVAHDVAAIEPLGTDGLRDGLVVGLGRSVTSDCIRLQFTSKGDESRAHLVALFDREETVPCAYAAAISEFAPLAASSAGDEKLLDPLAVGLVVEGLLLDRARPGDILALGRVAGHEGRARPAQLGPWDVDDRFGELNVVRLLTERICDGMDGRGQQAYPKRASGAATALTSVDRLLVASEDVGKAID
jgi:hypothetical protein